MLSDGRTGDHERPPVACPRTVMNWRKHPVFPPDSNASCGRRNGPSDISATDILSTAEDDETINKYIRLNGELCPVALDRDLRHAWLTQTTNYMAFSKGWTIFGPVTWC
ncbi:hypothetical protein PTI98_010284 [Pleurotus ostreatus]|nr:hypothetical protein PTI98_010284 [Pleurotus ostreatus]